MNHQNIIVAMALINGGSIADTVAGLVTDVETLSGTVSSQGDALDTLDGTVSTLGDDLDTLEGTVGTLSGTVSSQGDTLSSLSDAVNAVGLSRETVSGATPTITGQANTAYTCGTVTSISITPPQSGLIDVIFTSGSTAATLTVPNTVQWPDWFDPSSLEASTTYELSILDGVYGAVGMWQ